MSRIIFHIDVNSAFLSWTAIEQLKSGSEVDLREIPSIIGGDSSKRHGIVLAKSIPAKKFGIKTGEPCRHPDTAIHSVSGYCIEVAKLSKTLGIDFVGKNGGVVFYTFVLLK